MTQGPIKFPVNEAAKKRLEARKPRRMGRQLPTVSNSVTRHPAYRPDLEERLRADEKRRAMPEVLMLSVVIAVAVLTIVPVGLLAVIGYQ
ncbi:MAG: hypothetical protein AAF841_06025 [Pseudomonadota bacterium]